jgi:membrane-associated phospholipid phosphatase
LPAALLLALTADPAPVERGIAPAVGITVFSAGVAGGLRAGQHAHVAARSCRWCAPPAIDEAARNALRWRSRPWKLADTLSNVTFGAAHAWALGSLLGAGAADHRANAIDVLLVAEPVAVAAALNQLVKLEVLRERPGVHHHVFTTKSDDDILSFYSGHTTLTFASTVAAGTVASLRGYRGAPAVWTGGLVFATATGYLRIAADKHWLTDVLAGAAIGAALGATLPRLHLGAADTPTLAAKAPVAAPTWITFGGAF